MVITFYEYKRLQFESLYSLQNTIYVSGFYLAILMDPPRPTYPAIDLITEEIYCAVVDECYEPNPTRLMEFLYDWN